MHTTVQEPWHYDGWPQGEYATSVTPSNYCSFFTSDNSVSIDFSFQAISYNFDYDDYHRTGTYMSTLNTLPHLPPKALPVDYQKL